MKKFLVILAIFICTVGYAQTIKIQESEFSKGAQGETADLEKAYRDGINFDIFISENDSVYAVIDVEDANMFEKIRFFHVNTEEDFRIMLSADRVYPQMLVSLGCIYEIMNILSREHQLTFSLEYKLKGEKKPTYVGQSIYFNSSRIDETGVVYINE
jgi:hypothetical protein